MNALGFTLNDGQAAAAAQIEESIKARRHHLLSGDAGSGKTALMQVIAVGHHEKRKKFVCTAPTHQACTVLARKMKAAGIDVPVVTTHALLGLRPRPKGDRLEFVRDDKCPPVEADIVGIDECFVQSSLINTLRGLVRIDRIQPGDSIINAIGIDHVVAVSKREAECVTRIVVGGKEITSSCSHRFFTKRGLIRAESLGPGDQIISVSTAMRLLRDGISKTKKLDRSLLFSSLFDALVPATARIPSQNIHRPKSPEMRRWSETLAHLGRSESRHRDRAGEGVEPGEQTRCSEENQRPPERDRPSATNQGRERAATIQASGSSLRGSRNAVAYGICRNDWGASGGASSSLQDRYSEQGVDDCGGGGWVVARGDIAQTTGSTQRCVPAFSRVDRVEILQSTDPRLDCERDANGKLYLWDLQVARHSSFGVKGLLVHNCSMISDEMFEHINRWLHKRAVIFSGDPGQLFPVGEEESPTFATMHRSHLSEPMRQALGNPILEAAWAIRKSQGGEVDWSWCKPVHNAPYGVFVPRDPEAWMRKAFTSDEFNADSLRFRFICWTNKRVADVNAMIREWRYGPTDTPFVVGERALIRAPLVKARAIVLNTNEEVIVREIAASKNRGLSTWALTVETEDGMKIEAHMAQSQTEYQAKLGRLADDARTGDGTWKQFHGFKEALVTAQAPYALTTHNSQGLTLRNAMIDMPEFRRWVRANRGEGLRGLYVATTRPSHALICVGG